MSKCSLSGLSQRSRQVDLCHVMPKHISPVPRRRRDNGSTTYRPTRSRQNDSEHLDLSFKICSIFWMTMTNDSNSPRLVTDSHSPRQIQQSKQRQTGTGGFLSFFQLVENASAYASSYIRGFCLLCSTSKQRPWLLVLAQSPDGSCPSTWDIFAASGTHLINM